MVRVVVEEQRAVGESGEPPAEQQHVGSLGEALGDERPLALTAGELRERSTGELGAGDTPPVRDLETDGSHRGSGGPVGRRHGGGGVGGDLPRVPAIPTV